MSYIDVTGKTEEEAIQKALDQLGMDRDEVSVEILERAKSGFLGLGSTPARVRVSYGPEEEVQEIPQESAPLKPLTRPAEKKAEAPKAEQSRPRREERKPKEKRAEKKAEEEEIVIPPIDLPECTDENAGKITAFLQGLLEHLDSQASIKVYEVEKNRYKVILEGDKLGQLIGRRGETLDAIQQLTNYSINARKDKRVRVQIDAENYRAKREVSLENLAKKVAAKVTRYHRSMTLEPMNAYERHVIHAALQDVEGITTYSIGTEPNRRVVVAYEKDN